MSESLRAVMLKYIGEARERASAVHFLGFLEALDLGSSELTLEALHPILLRSYRNFLYSLLLEPDVVREALASLQGFCGWAYLRGYVDRDLSLVIEIPDSFPLEEIQDKLSQKERRAS